MVSPATAFVKAVAKVQARIKLLNTVRIHARRIWIHDLSSCRSADQSGATLIPISRFHLGITLKARPGNYEARHTVGDWVVRCRKLMQFGSRSARWSGCQKSFPDKPRVPSPRPSPLAKGRGCPEGG